MTRLHDALIGAAVVLTVEEFGPLHRVALAALVAAVCVTAAGVDGWRRARARQRVGWRQ